MPGSPFNHRQGYRRVVLQIEIFRARQRLKGVYGQAIGEQYIAGVERQVHARQQIAGAAFRRVEGQWQAAGPDGNGPGALKKDQTVGGQPRSGG
jgi:hypothetical protein